MWIYLEWYEKPWETIGFGARIIYGYHPYGKPNVNRPFGDGVLTHFRELMLCGGHFFTTLAFFPVLKLTRAKSFGWISYSTRQFHCAHGIPDSALPRPLPRMVCEGSQRLFLRHVGFICRCCGGGFEAKRHRRCTKLFLAYLNMSIKHTKLILRRKKKQVLRCVDCILNMCPCSPSFIFLLPMFINYVCL